MRRLLVVLLLAIAAIPVASGTAWACSVEGPESEAEVAAGYRYLAAHSRAVYVATVLEQTKDGAGGSGPVEYRVRVDQSLKGVVVGGVRLIETSTSSCGAVLRPGRAFVAEDGQGRVDISSATNFEVDRRVAEYLRYTRALPETGAPAVVGTLAALFAAMAVVGWNRVARRCVVPA